jgi:hypothetical protein
VGTWDFWLRNPQCKLHAAHGHRNLSTLFGHRNRSGLSALFASGLFALLALIPEQRARIIRERPRNTVYSLDNAAGGSVETTLRNPRK